MLLMMFGTGTHAVAITVSHRQDRQQQPQKPEKKQTPGTKAKPQSEIPALNDDNDQKLRNKLDKELALIKKYYTDRHDAAGFARYQLAEQQNVGDNLNDLKRAREQVLANLHIPIPN
ncbi:hypothetical protein BEL04_10865 [Mucilaginibacter sp. PPCGB 2223]|nr:hypothetical protein BEL04_10865 [Mucilaginibacter sp. PPCGB 2223]